MRYRIFFCCALIICIIFASKSWAGRKEKTAGILASFKGDVAVIRGESKLNAEKGMEIRCEDILEAGEESSALLTSGKDASFFLNENSALSAEEERDNVVYALKIGQVRGRLNVSRKIGIHAADVLITAGAAEIDISLDDEKGSQLYVMSGKAWWAHEKWSMRKTLKSGEFIVWGPGGVPSSNTVDKKNVEERLKWMPALESAEKSQD